MPIVATTDKRLKAIATVSGMMDNTMSYFGVIMKDTAPLTIAFYEAASEPKELFEVEGASYVSLYDIDKDVDRAVAKMDEFFKKYSE
jgi:hypothetical protein